MRKIAAQFILDGFILRKKGIVTLNDNGLIINVEYEVDNMDSRACVEFYNGILIPEFINYNNYKERSDIDRIIDDTKKIVVADSILSIYKIQQAHEKYQLGEILGWATKNVAELLGISSWAGEIKIGKKPGLVLIDGVDFDTMKLTANCSGKRLI